MKGGSVNFFNLVHLTKVIFSINNYIKKNYIILSQLHRIIFIYKLIKIKFTNLILLKIIYNFYYAMLL